MIMLLSWLRMLVSVSNPVVRGQLQEQYGGDGSQVMVPFKKSQFLCHKVRAITYEYFSHHPPQHIQELEALLLDILNGHFSLDQYHATMAALHKIHYQHQRLQEHFQTLSEALELDQHPTSQSLCISQGEQLSNFSSTRPQHAQNLDDQIEIPPLRITPNQEKQVCLQTSESQENSQDGEQQSRREILGEVGGTSRRTAYFAREEWKTDRSHSDESIHNFEKKGSGIYEANKSLEGMLVRQLMRDMTRDMFLSGEGSKREERVCQKYNKKIRETLIYSKLKARPKRK